MRAGGQVAAWELVSYGGLLTVALAMRLWDLGSRAMHHDESLHALYSYNLSVGTGYAHNPMMHGPLQMEATAGIFFVFGASDFTARLLYAVAGTALVGLPLLLRSRLGRLGAVFVSVMLAFSPALLYFSRFARNDILIALLSLGLVITLWRYLDEGKNRYLYAGAALLALTFATKESAYVLTFILGLYLLLVLVARSWSAIVQGITIGQVSPPVAIARLAGGAWSVARRGMTVSRVKRPGAFFVLLFTLSLPMGAALLSIFQDTFLLSWSNLVLSQSVGSLNIGAPMGGGLVVAAVVVGLLLWISAYYGVKWLRSVWWTCAGIFWVVLVLLYTTFFTNPVGIFSGVWKSLGYWLVQQGVARGEQPIYYYLIITPLYEFLPLLLGILGGVYYLRRRESFGIFLAFWAVATFIIHTYISEKMPWLLTTITLPLIVLSGKFLGDIVKGIEWRRAISTGAMLLLPGVPVLLLALWSLAFFTTDAWELIDALRLVLWVVIALGLVAVGVLLARRIGPRSFASLTVVPIAAVLLALTIRAGWIASFRYGDTPVEMIVYTQTSPDLARLFRQVEQTGKAQGDRTGTPILIDQASGFSWPWAWYLRDYTRVGYIDYPAAAESAVDKSVLVIHANNKPDTDVLSSDDYTRGFRIAHRRWFPETYRGLTLGKFLGGFVDRAVWRRSMDYFLYRKLQPQLGSEDAYVYFSRDFPVGFTPSQ